MSDTSIKVQVATVAPIASLDGVKFFAMDDAGVKRAYVRLSNGDIIEIAEPGLVIETQPPTPDPPTSDFNFLGVMMSPDGAFGYVGNQNNDSRPLWKWRTVDNEWVTPIACGNGPAYLSITPDGTKAYVSNFFDGTVSVIDTATNTVITTIPGFTQPVVSHVTPDGSTVYVCDYLANAVIRISTATDTIVGSPISVMGPLFLRVSPDGTKVYVSQSNATTAMSVISTATNLVTATILVSAPLTPGDFVFNTGATELYVRDGGNQIRRVSTATFTLTGAAIALGTLSVQGITINAAGTKIYVPAANGDVTVVSTATNLVIATISAVGVDPFGLQRLAAQGDYIYVSQFGFYGPANIFVIVSSTDTLLGVVEDVVIPDPVALGTFDTMLIIGADVVDEGGGVVSVTIATPPEASIPASNVFTFSPSSGLTGPVVLDDFNDLYAAFDAARTAAQGSGKFKIVFEDVYVGGPFNFVVLDSGAGAITYDFLYAELVGVHEDQNVFLDVKDGGGETDSLTIYNALWFEGLTVRATGQNTAFTVSDPQTVTLTRTTFLGGGGEYVMDFINSDDGTCVLHLNDESAIYRADGTDPTTFPDGTAACRVACDLSVHMNGANCRINGNAFVNGGGGSLDTVINSSSARFNFDQSDVGGVQGVMSTAAGYWTAGPAFPITDPNLMSLEATAGTQISDESTGIVWKSLGGMVWEATGSPPTVALYFDDFTNSIGYNQKPIVGGFAALATNPSGNGYYSGVLTLQAVAPGDEISIHITHDIYSSPIDGKQTIDFGGGPFMAEMRCSVLGLPTVTDDANVNILGDSPNKLGFSLGPGNLGNANWWAVGAAGPDIDTGVLATTDITKFTIRHDPTTDTMTWYIDGTLVATKVGAALSGITIGANVENVSNNLGLVLLIDYVRTIYITVR